MKVSRQNCNDHIEFSHELFKRNHDIKPPRFFDEATDGFVEALDEQDAKDKILVVLAYPDARMARMIKLQEVSPHVWNFKLPEYVTLRELTNQDIAKYLTLFPKEEQFTW